MFTTRPEIAGTFGVVASTHWIASQVGMAVLERGGNAFDAAAATAFTLQVANRTSTARVAMRRSSCTARTRTQQVICGQGVAPQAATVAKFRELGIDLIPAPACCPRWCPARSMPGACCCATGAPGNSPTCWTTRSAMPERRPRGAAHRRHDREHAPAVRDRVADVRRGVAARRQGPRRERCSPARHSPRPTTACAAKPIGDSPRGQIDAARGAWYGGFVAEAVDSFFRSIDVLDISGRRHRGLLTADDMAGWSATVEDPSPTTTRPHRAEMRPLEPGPGDAATLALLDGFDIGAMDPVGAEFVHTVVEARSSPTPTARPTTATPISPCADRALLSADYTAERRKLIGREASLDLRPGTEAGHSPVVDRAGAGRAIC